MATVRPPLSGDARERHSKSQLSTLQNYRIIDSSGFRPDVSKSKGMVVYQLDDGLMYQSDGTNWNRMWSAANDGASSGLDADLLDGNSSAFYLPASSYTAADVLAKMLTVDGAGSLLDADLLDAQSSAYYLNAGNLNAGTLPEARGGTALTSLATFGWTPSWTNLTVGNGTQEAYYFQIGKFAYFNIIVTFGSTSSITGLPRVTLPNGWTFRSIMPAMSIHYVDASAAAHYVGTGAVISIGTAMDCYVINASTTYATRTNVSSTVPFTWTTTDILRIGITTALA